MKISIVASGSRGDVQPYIALGKALKDVGHTVCIVTNDDFEALVNNTSLAFASAGESVEAVVQSEAWRSVIAGGNFIKITGMMMSAMQERAQGIAHVLPQLLEGAELIVAGVAGMGGAFSIAEKFNIPIIQTYVFPMTPTSAFAGPLTPTLPFGSLLNRASYVPVRQMLWQSGRAIDVAVRKQLGMRAGSLFGPYRELAHQHIPVIYGYSNYVVPRPPDWDANTYVAGYWFLDQPADWNPPADLVDFLQAGPAPVYIGFGSMGDRNPEQTTRLVLDAVARTGQRAVLASGWGGLRQTEMPSTVHMLKSVPHSWLFPQMSAVVHHGGAGTTAAGVRAGVPSIITPFFGDQPFWGKRLADLGVGPAPIAKKALTAERLAQAITQAVSDPEMRQRAAALGAKVRAEDGANQAAKLITQLTESASNQRIAPTVLQSSTQST